MPAGGRQRGLCMVLAYQHKHKHNGIGRAIVTGVILVPAMPKYVCDIFDKKNNRRYWVDHYAVICAAMCCAFDIANEAGNSLTTLNSNKEWVKLPSNSDRVVGEDCYVFQRPEVAHRPKWLC
ncbi:hypothetical protein L207DRAFT_534698 [Hyaloscypha variabilis F]|uniref:Uncharacterized protein n=1 Tax=Hyaloscypha variabilis (strain UAMH 11265 / GT02V1 / F) TaxID=1149755 RepID=A0A2J6R781_HYAVF|nr:hypothetical protein L207DRAFT_534698 [Hyaloscypha variabilis F]